MINILLKYFRKLDEHDTFIIVLNFGLYNKIDLTKLNNLPRVLKTEIVTVQSRFDYDFGFVEFMYLFVDLNSLIKCLLFSEKLLIHQI